MWCYLWILQQLYSMSQRVDAVTDHYKSPSIKDTGLESRRTIDAISNIDGLEQRLSSERQSNHSWHLNEIPLMRVTTTMLYMLQYYSRTYVAGGQVMQLWIDYWRVKPPLHRTATFVSPLSDQKSEQDAQWSPKPKQLCFYVTAAAWPLCVPWATKTAVVAQQVVQRRQSGGKTIVIMVAQWLPWSPNGGTLVATVITQWTLLVCQRRHTGGTREAEASLKLTHNVYNSTNYVTGAQWPTPVLPFGDHGDACAFLLPPLSDRPPRRPLCDCFEHAQNFTATMASMARSERPLCYPWTTKATFLLPVCLQRRPGQFCGRTREAQRSQPLCKGGITHSLCLLCATCCATTAASVVQGRHKGRAAAVTQKQNFLGSGDHWAS